MSAIDDYIAACDTGVQPLLNALRDAIREVVPEARESIAYGLPTFSLNRHLVHFGVFKRHIGFYPTSSGMTAFARELAAWPCSKGAVQFPLQGPLPLELIQRITRHRVEEDRHPRR